MIRRVEHRDLPAIREISRGIWGDTDYLPTIAPEWIDDPASEFIGYELDGRLVAVTRNNHLEPGLIWLEGIRVHGDYRGRGLARILGEHQLALALASSPERIELATYIDSTESLGLIASMGFGVVARFKCLEIGLEEIAPDHVDWQRVSSVEPMTIDRWIEEIHRTGGGYLSFDWTFRRVTPGLLMALIDRGEVYRTGTGAVVILTTLHAKGGSMTLRVLESRGSGELVGLVDQARRMAVGRGAEYLMMMRGSGEVEAGELLERGLAISYAEAPLDTFVFRYGEGEKFSIR